VAANALTHTNSSTTVLNLNDGVIYQLVEGSPRGIYGVPFDIVTADTPMRRPRGILLAAQPQARTIEIDLIVHGASRSAIITNLRALRKHLAIDARAGAMGQLTYTSDSTAQRVFRVTPLVDDREDVESWLRSGAAARGWAIVTLRFLALDPTCYNPTAVTPSGALSGTGNVSISCANAGDADAWVTITIGAGGTVATNLKVWDAYGTWLEFNDTVAAAETLVLTLNPQGLAMTHSVDGNWFHKRVSGSGLPVVKNGTNNMTFRGGDAGDNGAIAISFYSTYTSMG